mgnify:CR=1 FL=1
MNREGNLDLTSLRIFIETAKDCNMTRAASALGISQPAVSAAVKKVENALGSPVFDRDRRPIQLTTAGRLLWNRSFLILEQLDDLTRSIQFSLENKRPDLRLGASDCMSACVCPALIDYLLSQTENLSARTGSTPKITDLLKHKAVDIGLSSDSIGDVPRFQALHFLTERFLFVLPREITRGRKITCTQELISAVEKLPYLRFGQETFDFVQSERIYRSLHFIDQRRIEVDTNFAMIELVARGKGWTILPPLSMWMVSERIEEIDFLPLSIEATRRYFVIYQEPTFGSLAKKILKEVHKIFNNEIFPKMKKLRPELLEHIQLS